VLTARSFKLLFIYRARFYFGVLLSQNKLVSYRFSGARVCVKKNSDYRCAAEGGLSSVASAQLFVV
jgi:hypothetical protein